MPLIHLDGEREYWLARELYKILGYNKWENFEKVLAKAKIAVKFNGFEPGDHLLESRKLIKKGKGATQVPWMGVKCSEWGMRASVWF